MTAADWITDLARLAEAFPARERTWHMHEMDRVFVGPGEPGNLDGIVHMSADPLSDLDEKGAGEERRNGAWIAAANPATILRLIDQVREWHRVAVSNEAARNEARIERDRLAARLAAVEALADEWERSGGTYPAAWTYLLDAADRLRAVLSAAPTDTTKETSDD